MANLEITEAKNRVKELKAQGVAPECAVIRLNSEFEGHYYVVDGTVWRVNDHDYAPPIRIL